MPRHLALPDYLFARDLGRVFRVAEALEYGTVGVNTGLLSVDVVGQKGT